MSLKGFITNRTNIYIYIYICIIENMFQSQFIKLVFIHQFQCLPIKLKNYCMIECFNLDD